MPDERALSQMIKAEARRLGFHLVGITSAQPPDTFPYYLRWLENGYHGKMAYLASDRARHRRADMQLILPECQSIIVLGTHYCPADSIEPDQDRSVGKIASYAWNDDYHDVFKPRLISLVAFIEDQVGRSIPHRWYCDTGPLLERELARRAGLGWVGKNSMLINPQAGSYILLAELLLGIPLSPDKPFEQDLCGSCTACIDACPTTCITPDRTLDARRCISYLTIELKEAIPPELRPLIGNWVFGCDVCQQVCPWNQRFAPHEGDPHFAPRADLPYPDLKSELSLTDEEFNHKFKGSPVKRSKRRGYLRNVVVALGNQRHVQALNTMRTSLLNESEPLVRQHVAWALGQIGGEETYQILSEAQSVESDEHVLSEIHAALKSET